MSNLTVTLQQHAVGQGGMMSGLLEAAGNRFHWVYDCGSNQSEPLDREIATVAAVGPVDVLFLSHLDKDHVNGVDTLLTQAPVKEVVLPYLDPIARLVAVAHADVMGGLSRTFLALLESPERWFRERGVETVTFITPDTDDGGEFGPLEIPEGPGLDDGPLQTKWHRMYLAPQLAPPKGAPASLLHFGSVMVIPGVDWVLIPYAHKPSEKKLSAFRLALQNTFRRSYGTKSFFSSIVRDRQTRKQLRACYDEIWGDHNLVSMALYAGPAHAGHGWGLRALNRPFHRYGEFLKNYSDEAGWLSTGDMHLDVRLRRQRFLDFYKPVLERVNVFGLPHHGSRHNFHPMILPAIPNCSQAFAASGVNSYDHPCPFVERRIEDALIKFIRVGDTASSMLVWEHKA